MRSSLCLLVVLVCCFESLHDVSAQTMRNVYELDFIEYRRSGNHPKRVSQFWAAIGLSLNRELEQGKYPQLEERERICSALREVFGTNSQAIKESQKLILEEIGKIGRGAEADEVTRLERKQIYQANRTYEILGPELATQIVLRQLPNKKRRDWLLDSKTDYLLQHLQFEAFKKMLNITDAQEREIQRIREEFAQKFKKKSSESLGSIRIHVDGKWKSFLEAVTEEERANIEEIIGEPVQWYAEFDVPWQWARSQFSPFVPRSAAQLKSIFFYGSELPNRPIGKTVVWPDQLSEAELKAAGFFKTDKFLVDLMDSEFVRGYLDLNEQQELHWQKLKSKIDAKAILYFESSKQRITQLIEDRNKLYPDFLVSWLNKEQQREFCRLEFQARWFSRSTRTSVMGMARSLISDESKAKLEKLGVSTLFGPLRTINELHQRPRFMNEIHGVRIHGLMHDRTSIHIHEFAKCRFEVQDELRKQVRKILTEDQLKKYAEILSLQDNRPGVDKITEGQDNNNE